MTKLRCLFLFILFTVLPIEGFAANMCWIDNVKADNNGVTIYFIEKSMLNCYGIENCTITQETNNESKYIHLKNGDQISVSQMAEDTCSLKVESRGNHIGVTATSYMHLPGTPARETKQFIQAQE